MQGSQVCKIGDYGANFQVIIQCWKYHQLKYKMENAVNDTLLKGSNIRNIVFHRHPYCEPPAFYDPLNQEADKREQMENKME